MSRNEESLKTLGEHLKSWRIMLGISQEIAAQRAYLSIPAVRRAERGDPGVSMATFIKLASVVGMDQFLVDAIDPLNHDLGQARAHMLHRKRASKT